MAVVVELLINALAILVLAAAVMCCKTSSKKQTHQTSPLDKDKEKDVVLTKSVELEINEQQPKPATPKATPPPNVPIGPKRKNDDTLRNVPSLKQEEPSSQA